MITWNWFDTDCKNEWAIFTRLISLTGPLSLREVNNSNMKEYWEQNISFGVTKILEFGLEIFSLSQAWVLQLNPTEFDVIHYINYI